MSNTMNPILIRTANKKPTQKNFDFRHQGTSDWFKPQIIHCQRMTPGETAKINCNVELHSRPLAMPAGVRVHHNLRAFWVPAWAAHKDWFRFRTNVPFTLSVAGERVYAKHNLDTYIVNHWLVNCFLQTRTIPYYSTDSLEFVDHAYDPEGSEEFEPKDVTITIFSKTDEQTVLGYLRFNFSESGKILYNTLIQLGYEIKWAVIWSSNNTFPTSSQGLTPSDFVAKTEGFSKDKKISARALLSLIKIMIDWYVPTQYEEYFEQQWENQLERDSFGGDWTESTDLISLLTWVNYEQDRFNGAWRTPTGPNNESSTFNIEDNSVINLSNPQMRSAATNVTNGTINSTGTPIIRTAKDSMGNQTNYVYNLSDYILRALNAIQNFTTRNRIAGYRPIDRMLAHFGVHVDYKLIKRSTYITGTSQAFNQNATSNTANLEGAFESANWLDDVGIIGGAGATMHSQGNLNFTWSAEDDGYIIIIDTILPRSGYYQGMKHHNNMCDWRELYIPEFDNLGTEAIRRSEVFNAYNDLLTDLSDAPGNDELIWGFEPTNAGMKTGYDTLSGDFRRKSINLGIESMHTMRVFADDGGNVPPSIEPEFIKGDSEEYNRIFQYTGKLADHFQFLAVTTDKGKGPWDSISESLPITDGEGQNAEFNYGGSTYMN